jgi:TPR repeat protein
MSLIEPLWIRRKLRREAESRSRVAQSALGICYFYGIDVKIDYVEAFRLLSAAGTSRAVASPGCIPKG